MAKKDPGDEVDLEEAGNEAKLLNQLRLKSFTATPKTIRPFEDCTLAWDVSVPPAVAAALEALHFTVGGSAPLGRVGSITVSPLTTGAFVLRAHGEVASRVLGTVIVTVDLSGCQQLEIKSLQLRSQAEKLRSQFLAGSIQARGSVSVSSSAEGLRVSTPLKIEIPNFYDADADVVLQLVITAANSRAFVRLADIDVDIIFHVAEHIFSLGAATAAQSMLEPFAEDLIKAFLGQQLERNLSDGLNEVLAQLMKLWQAGDAEERVFRLHSLTTTNTGLVITGCPV